MEHNQEQPDDVVRIDQERYHLRDWSDEEIRNFIHYRHQDQANAQRDINKAMQVWDERHPKPEPIHKQQEFWD